jgi:hypothetical protein
MMMQPEGPVGEGGGEQETTCVCPNCGATLKIEVEGPEAEDSGPSIREALTGAMGA